MAAAKSMGTYVPVALPYLVSEGILPENPSKDSYQWEIYVYRDADDEETEEEVLITSKCVVWSRGRSIQNVYRFDVEGEDVVQAILTQFRANDKPLHLPSPRTDADRNTPPLHTLTDTRKLGHVDRRLVRNEISDSAPSHRALVVFLKSKAHICFLHGPTYILDLPIEVERAFPAPCGVIIQRKPPSLPPLPPTPKVPGPPPNSFYSSQIRVSSSYLQSPTATKSFGNIQPPRPSPLGSNNRLDAVFQEIFGSSTEAAEENLAPLYSLTNPLSDIGILSYSLQYQKPRVSGKQRPGLTVEFEPLDANEQLVYVSPKNELANEEQDDQGPLMLLVTANYDLQTLTVWHAWYVDEKSLSSLMKQRAANKAAKARRRSSFLSAGMATGTATPAVRHREGTRESFAAGGPARLPGEPVSAHPGVTSSKKPTRQEEENAMALQMDPDYQPIASQQTARESRRISSLNTDVRASQSVANASFVGPGGRRNASFGGPNERRSFGLRKSRGSTPGSTFSRSIGPDDDLMDIDSSIEADGRESVESILAHVRATLEAIGADNIFGGADGDFKKDVILRKLHSLPLSSLDTSPISAASNVRIVTLRDVIARPDSDDQRMNVYIHNRTTQALVCLHLQVKHRLLWPDSNHSPNIAVPYVVSEEQIGSCKEVVKIKTRNTEAVLLAEKGLIFSLDNQTSWLPVPPLHLSRSPLQPPALQREDKEESRARQVKDRYILAHPGVTGALDKIGANVCQREQIKLRPDDRQLDKLLELCQLVLTYHAANAILRFWYIAHTWLMEHPEALGGTALNIEWVAFATAAFSVIIPSASRKAGKSLDLSQRVTNSGLETIAGLSRRHQEHTISKQTAWQSLLEKSRVTGLNLTSTKNQEKDHFLNISHALSSHLRRDASEKSSEMSGALEPTTAAKLILALHVFREEQKLCALKARNQSIDTLALIIAQLGSSLSLPAWSYSPGSYYYLEGVSEQDWGFVKTNAPLAQIQIPLMIEPVGVFQWFEHAIQTKSGEGYPTLDTVAAVDGALPQTQRFKTQCRSLTPRIASLSDVLEATSGLTTDVATTVRLMADFGITTRLLETLPIAIAAPFREAIAGCEKQPPTTWSSDLLNLVGRDDLNANALNNPRPLTKVQNTSLSSRRDIQTVCNALDHHSPSVKTKEADRNAVSQLVFHEDRRLLEATSLMRYNSPQLAACPKQPDWSDAYHLEQQRKVMQWVTIRMIALPAGDAMIHFDSRTPLLTDKYHLAGFSNSCLMQPMGHTLTTDRSGLTEEKVNWAYFHAGVSAGLRISRSVNGIDTSWIAFNKPNDLTNRHAGLLLALGLNGHLRNVAKWLSFKYLTPKHTMTSVGLLMGLSASYMGTMDGLITRMLSVHITRMLPSGAAELNVSPITQTAGLMGIGLLYYNTQHRRMSEVMLSEVEHRELEDPDSGPDPLRDESYRLAAGFALGFINLGQGRDLRGLHGMHLPERLLAVAVGPRPVNAVHVFDRATAGAVVAVALVYMKSGDKAIARKIDIPDTEAQFDHVRPDILLLRTMTKHLILWDSIVVKESPRGIPGWIQDNLPMCYISNFRLIHKEGSQRGLKSSDIPFFNIATGLAWALSLKYAGSGNLHARDEILTVLDYFSIVQRGQGSHTGFSNYDTKLTGSTLRRCIDVLAVSAATVMAGTGDLGTFRFLRRLHGRTDSETTYGSHLAAHLAIGVLFLGGGTYTFGTSDLAIGSLICAFYPLYPTEVHDNHVHLQAFRHLWVFAAEARCLVVEDIDTQRPMSMPILVTLKDGSSKSMAAPCLLPELDSIATVQTTDPAYWRVTLDFAGNPQQLSAFKANQRILVRRCPASEAHSSVFSATISALNDLPPLAPSAVAAPQETWRSIFELAAFKDLDKADLELILPPDPNSSIYTDERGTVVDDRLELNTSVNAADRDSLWNLRLMFAFADKATGEGEDGLKRIDNEVVEALWARIEERQRKLEAVATF